MFSKRKHIFVGLTTFDLAALNVSIPQLGGLGRGFTLVVHNGNPDEKLARKTVRKLGWHGPLYVINATDNVGEWGARLAILDFIKEKNLCPEWITFLDDGDILLDTDIPKVADENFAIIQNATVLKNNFADFFRINRKWVSGTDCGTTGAHFDIRGTWIRTKILLEFNDFIRPILPKIYETAKNLKYRLNIGEVLWNGLNIFVREKYPFMSAIYMNKTNYVVIHFGRYVSKYKQRIAPDNVRKAFNKEAYECFAKLFQDAVTENIVAPE